MEEKREIKVSKFVVIPILAALIVAGTMVLATKVQVYKPFWHK